MTVFLGLMIPFLGTTSRCGLRVFLKELGANVQKVLLVLPELWWQLLSGSLLIPSMDLSASMGRLASSRPAEGCWPAWLCFFMDRCPGIFTWSREGGRTQLFAKKVPCWYWQLLPSENIPEGMAVGGFCRHAGRKCILLRLRLCPRYWYCHSELPGRSHHFPLPKAENDMMESLQEECRCGGAHCSLSTILLSDLLTPVLPWFLSLCCRSHALCGSRRTDPRGQ